MDIVILSNFCMDFSASDNDRFLYIAKLLAKSNTVEIITSDFFHAQKEKRNATAREWPFKITFLYESGYQKNVCLKRFYSHYIWGRSVKKYLKNRKKPDVIYCAVPSLSGSYYAAKYCEKNDVRFIIDIQDLWPEAFYMVHHIPILSNLLFWPFKMLANEIYKRADKVIAVSQTYVNRALEVNRKDHKGYAVYIGTELKTFDSNVEKQKISSKTEGELWLGYCGSLEASYDLITVMDAIVLLKERNRQVLKFIVMGAGSRQEEFKTYAKKTGVQCVFLGKLPYDKMCGILSACDIVINPITKGSAASIINKHADYAACGKPVINTQENKEYRKLIKAYRMGINCENSNAIDMANKLERLIYDVRLREVMGNNARKCAEKKFDRSHSYSKIVDVILQIKVNSNE